MRLAQLRRALPLLLVTLSPPVMAKAVVADPGSKLSLDFEVPDARSCILYPEALRDPVACEGLATPKDPEKLGPGLQLMGLVRQKGTETVVFTVVSASQRGIGQLTEARLEGVVKGWVSTRAKGFKANTQLNREGGASYTLYRVGDVPVVRWSYTSEVPATDPKAARASSVVYLVPSRDQLDFISFSTRTDNLPATRVLGDRVLSTLSVPLTIDNKRFGISTAALAGEAVGRLAVGCSGLMVVVIGAVLLWFLVLRRPPTPPPPAPPPPRV